jgi:hypothetical protein
MLVITAQLSQAFWWKAIFYSTTSILIVLLFGSFGLYGILKSLTSKRADRWLERCTLFVGGCAVVGLGFWGAWLFLNSVMFK